MTCWSAESATKAYLRAIKMVRKYSFENFNQQNSVSHLEINFVSQEKSAREPDVSEFISALAAGNKAKLMVLACAGAADSTTLALVAAAHQTGGRVICILREFDKLNPSIEFLQHNAMHVEFVIGDAELY